MEILSRFSNRLLYITKLIIGGGRGIELGGGVNFKISNKRGRGGGDYLVLESTYYLVSMLFE